MAAQTPSKTFGFCLGNSAIHGAGHFENLSARAVADQQRTAELQQVSTSFFEKLEKESPTNFKYMNFYSKGAGSKINNTIYNTNWEKGPHAALIHSLDDTISKYPALDAETWFFI